MPARAVRNVEVDGRAVALSNLHKILYPKTGFTKADVLDYYARIAPAMVPHLKGRALNLKRYPDGVEAPHFYQKEAPKNTPPWLKTVRIWSDTKGAAIKFTTASDRASLIWLANTGNLEFHTLLSRGDDPETPTMLVFDLDPGVGVGVVEAAAVALLVREDLRGMGLKSFAKVSGGKGVQAYVPLNTPCSFEASRAVALSLAHALERQHPEAVVSNMRKALRQGKVLVDYSQNSRHKSTVCAYSLRARPEPSVACPISWAELEDAVARRDAGLLRFTPAQALDRVARLGDLFAPVLRLKQKLPEAPEGLKKAPGAARRRPRQSTGKAVRSKKRPVLQRPWAQRPKAP